jgi:hypothetical protein
MYRPPRPEREQVVVEVRPTVPADETEREDDRRMERDGGRLDDAVEVLREGRPTDQPPDGGKRGDSGGRKKEGKAKTQKKLGRAERRRQIKEEIQRLAQGNERGLYQPRLW